MSGVQGLFGGDAADEQKQKAEDFIRRYESGHPAEGYSEEEALAQLRQVAQHATPAQMQAAFRQSIAGLPENERAQFNQMLQQRQAGKGMIDIERSGDRTDVSGRESDSSGQVGLDDLLGGLLGGASGGSASGGGDILGGLLGGLLGATGTAPAGGGVLGSILGGATESQAQAQPAPEPKKKDDDDGGLGDIFGDILKGPAGKAILAGTAAFAMKEILGGNK